MLAMRLPTPTPRSRFFQAVVTLVLLTSVPSLRAANLAANPQGSGSVGSAQLVCTPASLQFGEVAVGRTKAATLSIGNLGRSSISLSRIITTGGGFGVRGLDFPLTLASGERFTFAADFAPLSKGDSSGSISFVAEGTEAANPAALTIALSGTGTDAGLLVVAPSALNFGATRVGTHTIQVGTIQAANSAVTIFAAESSSPEFALQGMSFPVTIPAGEGRLFTVTFKPQVAGAAAGSVSFRSDSGNLPIVQSLIGTAISSGPRRVDLSWNPSVSPNVAGYNIYRATISGGPYTQINSVLDANFVFTDDSTADGQTYYYVTTAVDLSGRESAQSNEAAILAVTQ